MPSRALIVATAILVTLASQTSSAERPEGEHRSPPAEALEACTTQIEGADCAFDGRRNDRLRGTCRVVRSGDLACVPDNHHHGDRERPLDRDPG